MVNLEFKKAVQNNDNIAIRSILCDSIIIDTTYNTFNQLLKYVEKKHLDIYDEHDGESFIEDRNLWDKKYLNKEMVRLLYNFSKARIDFVKELCDELYNANKTIVNSSDDHSYQYNGPKDIGSLKAELYSSLIDDKTLKTFDKLLEEIPEEDKVGLYEKEKEINSKEIIFNIRNITDGEELKKLYKKYCISLSENFSKERIKILREISSQLELYGG